MDSGGYSAPPSFTSGGWRTVKPPPYHQPTAAVEYDIQPPSLSSTVINNNSDPQLPTYDQRTVAGEYEVQFQPPSYSAFNHVGGSSTDQLTGRYGDRQLDYGGPPPSLDALVHDNNSAVGFNVYNGYEQPPSLSGVAPIIPSNPGVSGGTPTVDPQETAGFSIVGSRFPRASLI